MARLRRPLCRLLDLNAFPRGDALRERTIRLRPLLSLYHTRQPTRQVGGCTVRAESGDVSYGCYLSCTTAGDAVDVKGQRWLREVPLHLQLHSNPSNSPLPSGVVLTPSPILMVQPSLPSALLLTFNNLTEIR